MPLTPLNPPEEPTSPASQKRKCCLVERGDHEYRSSCGGGKLRFLLRFICRLDVCWTLFFFLFLMCVAALTTSITETFIFRNVLATWHLIHSIRIVSITQRIDTSNRYMAVMARGFLTLHLQKPLSVTSEHTLSLLCASLDHFDLAILFRGFSFISLVKANMMGCAHGLLNTGSMETLSGYISSPELDNGTYLIDRNTYYFVRPFVQMSLWPEAARNTSAHIPQTYGSLPILTTAEAYYNGTVDHVDPHIFWAYPSSLPHLILYTLPIGVVARGTTLSKDQYATDFVQVRFDGSQLLVDYDTIRSTDFSVAAFINQSLDKTDPLVLSNNWGQKSVSNNSIYSTAAYLNVTYLAVSNISNRLMRAALKHIDLKRLQQEGHNQTVDFQYRGAPATATAVHMTLSNGLQIPLVFASSNADVAGPYRRIMDICNGVTAVVIVAFTALFWWFAHTYFSEPLRRMTELLLASVVTGRRTMMRTGGAGCIEVSEVRQLAAAHNAMMRQLRDIDAFVPPTARELIRQGCTVGTAADSVVSATLSSVSRELRRPDSLRPQPATLVYVTIRPRGARDAGGDAAVVPMLPGYVASTARKRQRLVSVVEETAHAHSMTNSGPFSSPAALASFASAVKKLCTRYGGLVQMLCPDRCLLCFGAHARSGDETAACATQDALGAVCFMQDLQRWWDAQEPAELPDVRMLADSGVFVCGQYRARGNEQTLSVALGRDVQRKLGHVPALLGVRITITEETAVLVYPAGVRVVPVAALRVGRPHLNADVVILYEVLPGDGVQNAAWRLYAQCCTDGFECMVRGDYSGALRAYKGVASISDLEPGLMPSSLRREAASSAVSGGAVSVQVQRLMRECERCLRDGSTGAYLHVRHVPLGIDAVLGDAVVAAAPVRAAATGPFVVRRRSAVPLSTSPSKRADAWGGVSARTVHKARERHLVTTTAGAAALRCVVGDFPPFVVDQRGVLWRIPAGANAAALACHRRLSFTALGSAGTLCTAVFHVFRDVPPVIAKAVRDAPDGPLSDTLRSAVPVWEASARQRDVAARLFDGHRIYHHPNILRPVGYSLSVEGGVVALWEFCPGGSLRQLVLRYPMLNPVVILRYGFCVLSALSYMHSRGIIHGSLSLDTIIAGADGVCRVMSQSSHLHMARELVALPRTCYVSPAMAAGALPTTACDMFCYGLLSVEAVSRSPAWMWAPVKEGERQGSEEELAALMAEGGAAFSAAVVGGRVVPNTAVLDAAVVLDSYNQLARDTVHRCLATDPQLRPTAEEVWEVNKILLAHAGLAAEEEEDNAPVLG